MIPFGRPNTPTPAAPPGKVNSLRNESGGPRLGRLGLALPYVVGLALFLVLVFGFRLTSVLVGPLCLFISITLRQLWPRRPSPPSSEAPKDCS